MESQKLRILACLLIIFSFVDLHADDFVSLRSNKTFLRKGPSKNYPVKWVYVRKGEPLKVIARFENWCKVRDFSGEVGWVHRSVVSGFKSGIVKTKTPIILFNSAGNDSKKLLRLEPGVRVSIKKCTQEWCKARVDKITGWIKRAYLWGDVSLKK